MAVRLRASSKTSAEDVLAMQLNAGGFEFQRQFEYAAGRRLRADFQVLSEDWHRIVLVEVVGGVYTRQAHGSVTGVLADIDRLNEASMNGYRMLRFTPQQVEDGSAVTMIRRALDEPYWHEGQSKYEKALKERELEATRGD